MFHGGMQVGGKAKADPQFFEAEFDGGDWGIDADAECCEDVGRSCFARNAAIAMLGDRHSGGGGDEGGGGTDIECAGGITAGAAGVEQSGAAGADGSHVLAESCRRPGDFRHGFTFAAQGEQEFAHLFGRQGPAHHLIDGLGHLALFEVSAGAKFSEQWRDQREGSRGSGVHASENWRNVRLVDRLLEIYNQATRGKNASVHLLGCAVGCRQGTWALWLE